jgi:hypothetical protein
MCRKISHWHKLPSPISNDDGSVKNVNVSSIQERLNPKDFLEGELMKLRDRDEILPEQIIGLQ